MSATIFTPAQVAELISDDCTRRTCFKESFYQFLVLSMLLNIVDAIEDIEIDGGGGSSSPHNATWIPMAQELAGDIGADFGLVLSDSHDKLYISVVNYTDSRVILSFDGEDDHAVVGPNGGSVTLNLGSNGLKNNTGVWARYDSNDTAPTVGILYVSASY